MEFRILGPLEVVDEGRSLPLGGARQRALLTALILRVNQVVSTDQLLDEVWSDEPPPSGVRVIQVYVSQLRKVLGEGVILTRPPGYVLEASPDSLDLQHFERLVVQARGAEPADAAATLREAFALWRGPPLADFAYDSFAQIEIARLEELRLSALEARIEADLRLSRHAELVSELEALVGEHPLREGLRGQLMLALYRSGRQAEALEAYKQGRAALVEELGIEPGRQLRDLETAILRQDLSLDMIPIEDTGETAEGSRTAFVGRDTELQELLDGLNEAVAGRGRLCLLVGEPGIGKSRLADELIRQARTRGTRVLVGRCWEAGGAPAYWPWVQSLRTYIRESDPEELHAQLGVGAPEVAQILPELRETFPELPPPASIESEAARFRFFDATVQFLRNAAESRPILLVLDDLHASDAPSLLLLQFLARELGAMRMLVICAYRDVDPVPGQPLTGLLAELAREPVTRRLPLTGLSEQEVTEYVERTTAELVSDELIEALYAETEGNPLFVGEVTRLLLGEGGLEPAAARSGFRIPRGVHDVIGRRLRRLSEDAQRALAYASVLGREFSLDTLARLSEFPQSVLLDVLDEAVAERVVDEVPGAPGRRRFAHALIRDVLYQELTPSHRLRLHERAGEALEAVYADRLESHLTELAHHFVEAAPAGDPAKAVGYARRAGDRAAELLAFEEAARLYRLALSLTEAEGATGRRHRCELLVALGDVLARTGDMPAARETFLDAAKLAGEIGSGELVAQAALGYGGRFVWIRATEDERIVPLLEQAAAALGQEESPLRARVLARLASALSQHAPEASNSLSAEALDVARRLDDPATLAYAISGRLWATRAPTELEERLTLASELIEAGDKERAIEGRSCRMMVLLALGDIAGFRQELAAVAQLADELGQPSQRWWVAAHEALLALLEGRLAEAEQLIERARALGERAQSYDAPIFFQLQRFALRRETGRLAEVLTDLRRAAEADPSRSLLRSALALAYWELRQRRPALRLLGELAADDFAQLAINNDWLLSAALLAELSASADDIDRAEALYHRLAPYQGLNVDTIEVSMGAVSRYLGLLATATGRLDEAAHHFAEALAMNKRMGAGHWLAHTQEDFARMLLSRGDAADRRQAAELLATSDTTFRGLGMPSRRR